MSEWIEWKGGVCPVLQGTLIDVKHRDGKEFEDIECLVHFSNYDWQHSDDDGDIVAYRIANKPMLPVKFKRLHQDAKTPSYATDGAACMDVRALHGGWIEPGESTLFSTGLAFEVPDGYAMMVYSRSGHGFNHGTRLSNAVGCIDSDYRGEILVKLHNDGWDRVTVNAGDRIAQFMIVEAPKFKLMEVDELSATDRGTGGLGHTGQA